MRGRKRSKPDHSRESPDPGQDPVRQALVRYVASGLVAVVLVSLLGVWLFARAGEAEAIRDAKDQTRIAAAGFGRARPERRALARRPEGARCARSSRPGAGAERPVHRSRVKIWDTLRPSGLFRRASPDRGALRAEPKRPRRVRRQASRRGGEQPLEAGESVRAPVRQAARGLHADPNPKRAAPPIRDVLPLDASSRPAGGGSFGSSRRRCSARSSCSP